MNGLDDRTLSALGLKSFASGWRSMAALVAAAALVMLASAAWTGHLGALARDVRRRPRVLVFWGALLLLYPLWGFVQQGAVFGFLHALRLWLPPQALAWAPGITALAFAALHVPNYHLMFSVGFMAALFITHMDLHHNLAAVAVAHGVLATLWRLLSPPAVSTTLNVWGWYAAGQRELNADLAAGAERDRRWARAPGFQWVRRAAGRE